MYKDYYKILGIHFSTTLEDIKKKYRELAKKWHPDINHSADATSKMQEITEAYLLLSDTEARKRYDIIHEYLFREKTQYPSEERQDYYRGKEFKSKPSKTEQDSQRESTILVDQILDNWISNARQQAKDFVIQSLKDAKGITANGCKYTLFAIGITVILFILILIVLSIA